MKTKEELDAIREEIDALNKKLRELTKEELEQVTGGITLYDFERPAEDPFKFDVPSSKEQYENHMYKNQVDDSEKFKWKF